MKKILAKLLIITAIFALVGCSSSSSNDSASSMSSSSSTSGTTSTTESDTYSGEMSFTDDVKLVYNGDITVQTTDFESTSQSLKDLVSRYDGYFSFSNTSSRSAGYYYGSYTIRIPSEDYYNFCSELGENNYIVSERTTIDDISEVYYDTQSRLETQKIKLERLQLLLEQAVNMEDIITIESAISETQWQIDNLSGEMRTYDSLVDYATINIYIDEVYQLSNVQEAPKTFIERIGNEIASGVEDFISGLGNITAFLAYNLMNIIVLIVVIVFVYPFAKKIRARRKRREDTEKSE